jgi:hypothetical protein
MNRSLINILQYKEYLHLSRQNLYNNKIIYDYNKNTTTYTPKQKLWKNTIPIIEIMYTDLYKLIKKITINPYISKKSLDIIKNIIVDLFSYIDSKCKIKISWQIHLFPSQFYSDNETEIKTNIRNIILISRIFNITIENECCLENIMLIPLYMSLCKNSRSGGNGIRYPNSILNVEYMREEEQFIPIEWFISKYSIELMSREIKKQIPSVYSIFRERLSTIKRNVYENENIRI